MERLHKLIGQWQRIDTLPSPASEQRELDLGCGKGSFTAELARIYPEKTIFGADIKIDRLRKMLNKAKQNKSDNLHGLYCLAWELIAAQSPDQYFDRIHVLCPDPWPKDKHRRNRLLSSEFLASLCSKIKTGGTLHLATDDIPYFEWMKTVTSQAPYLLAESELIDDVRHIQTDFEREFAKEGKPVHHLSFRTLPF